MLDKLKVKTYSVLRWSEKFTKTDMVYLAKGGSWMMIERSVAMVSAFVLSIAFANLLSKETYGQYRFVVSIVNLLMIFTLSGMGTAVVRAVAQGRDGVLRPAIKTEINWGILGSLVALMLANLYYWQKNYTLAPAFLMVAFFAPFLNVYSLYAAVLQGKKRFDLLVRYDVFTQLSNFVLLLLALFITKQVWMLILPVLLINSVFPKIWLKRTEKHVSLNLIDDSEAIRYGKHLSLINTLSTAATYADQLIIFTFLGPVQMAIYNMALAPTEQMKGLVKTIMPLAFPKFSQQSVNFLNKSIHKKVVIVTLFTMICLVVYMLLAHDLYAILFPKYLDAVLYTRLLAISLFTSAAATLYLAALQSQGARRELYSLNIASAFIQLPLILVMILMYGLMGAVLARIIVRTLDTVLALAGWQVFVKSKEL